MPALQSGLDSTTQPLARNTGLASIDGNVWGVHAGLLQRSFGERTVPPLRRVGEEEGEGNEREREWGRTAGSQERHRAPCAANAGVRLAGARREALLAVARDAQITDSPIDRPVDPSPRTVKGTTALSPSPAFWSPEGVAVGWVGSARSRRPFFRPRTSRPQRRPPCVQTGQVLACSPGVSCVLIQAADPIALTPAPPRRCCDGSSIAATILEAASHHPASAPTAPSRSALATSNHSDMAANT